MPKPATALALLLTLLIVSPVASHDGEHAEDPAASVSQSGERDRRDREGRGREKKPHAPVSAYKHDELLGWKLHVHEDLLADEELYKQVKGELHHQLFRITRVVPEDKVALLKKVPIWLELQNPNSSSCQYHPSKDWLVNNGYLAEKARCVDIGSAERFLRTTRTTQPYVMLHELAHAYDHQHLGFNDPRVVEAYKAARASGKFEKVLHISGREVRHYAMSNHKEYFAECTEAFFGTNDYYPYVRSELKEADPAIFAILKEIWGVK